MGRCGQCQYFVKFRLDDGMLVSVCEFTKDPRYISSICIDNKFKEKVVNKKMDDEELIEIAGKIETSYERVSALKNERYNTDIDTTEIFYLPQIEIVKWSHRSGDTLESKFVCISEEDSESGIAEFKDEIEAIKHAIEFRKKLREK